MTMKLIKDLQTGDILFVVKPSIVNLIKCTKDSFCIDIATVQSVVANKRKLGNMEIDYIDIIADNADEFYEVNINAAYAEEISYKTLAYHITTSFDDAKKILREKQLKFNSQIDFCKEHNHTSFITEKFKDEEIIK